MNRIAGFVQAWSLGIKYLLLTGMILFVAVLSGGIAALPFAWVAKLLGLHGSGIGFILVGVILLVPYFVGMGFPVAFKVLTDEAQQGGA